VKTAREHDRLIEDFGDDIFRRVLDFIYVHSIVLWGTCKTMSGLSGLLSEHELEKHAKVD